MGGREREGGWVRQDLVMNTMLYRQQKSPGSRTAQRCTGRESTGHELQALLNQVKEGFRGRRPLGALVQGSQQVTALEEVEAALQRDVDLTVVTGQLRQTGGLKWRAQQTSRYAWKTTEAESLVEDVGTSQCSSFKRRIHAETLVKRFEVSGNLPQSSNEPDDLNPAVCVIK